MADGAAQRLQNEHGFRLACPRCRDPRPEVYEDFSAGDLICTRCGAVLGDRVVDTRSEWRSFSSDGVTDSSDPSRVGGPANPLLEGTDQLGTLISGKDNYTGLSHDLNRLQTRSTTRPGERALLAAFREIGQLCDRMNLPRAIADRARQLYKLADDRRVFKGSRDAEGAAVGACLYVACRQENVVRAFKDISALTRVSKRDLGRCFKMLAPVLETRMTTVTAEAFVVRYCAYLRLETPVQRAAVHVAERISALGVAAGKSPTSIASAVVFMASHLFPATPAVRKQPREISFVSGVSEGTIRGTYRDLCAFKADLLPPDLLSASVHLPAS